MRDAWSDSYSRVGTGASTGSDGGGGIYDAGTGTTITESTVAEDTARISSASGSDGGGGIYDGGGPSVYLNDTISYNSVTVDAPGAENGSGALFHDGSPGSISDVTIDQNFSNQAGRGIFNDAGAYTLKNTIVANNGTGCAGPGTITSAGFNLEGSATCELTMPSDLRNTDPRLGPLVDNGGPTLTRALTAASPAIDAGSCTDALGNVVTTDQRGTPRPEPAAGRCDIGAFEFLPRSPVPGLVGGARPVVVSREQHARNVLRRRQSRRAADHGTLPIWPGHALPAGCFGHGPQPIDARCRDRPRLRASKRLGVRLWGSCPRLCTTSGLSLPTLPATLSAPIRHS